MREIYIIFKSSGSWDSYYEELHSAFLDEKLANKELERLNDELEKIKSSDEYREFSENWGSGEGEFESRDRELYLFEKYHEIHEQNLYKIEKCNLKDYYYTSRNENIGEVLK